MGPLIERPARQPIALLILALVLLACIIVGMTRRQAAHERVESSPGRLQQVTFERLPGYPGDQPMVHDTIIASDTGALFRTITTTDPRGTKTAVSARTMAEADFQRLETLINDSHFFEVEHYRVALHASSVRISALRDNRQHSVEASDDFALAPPQFRAIVSLFDRLAAPVSSHSDDVADAAAGAK